MLLAHENSLIVVGQISDLPSPIHREARVV
jgi:hypothetical protein